MAGTGVAGTGSLAGKATSCAKALWSDGGCEGLGEAVGLEVVLRKHQPSSLHPELTGYYLPLTSRLPADLFTVSP